MPVVDLPLTTPLSPLHLLIDVGHSVGSLFTLTPVHARIVSDQDWVFSWIGIEFVLEGVAANVFCVVPG